MQDELGMSDVDPELTITGGGRAGVHQYGWVQAGYNLDDVESVRQQFLAMNDVGQVQKAMRQAGLIIERTTLQLVKQYNFDSKGIGFRYENYAAWRKLVTGKGTIGDAAYIIHEITEVQELQRVQQQTGFDFMGKNVDKLPRRRQEQWKYDFYQHYTLSHSQALKAEYEFIIQQILEVTNERVKVSLFQVAAIDPTRYISTKIHETEAARHMFVDGVVMREHHHYDAWCRQANKMIRLSKAMQQRLGYYRPKITLLKLIMYVKIIPLN